MTDIDEKYREEARQAYAIDDLQIDADAEVSIGEHGAYVQAWVFVPETDVI